MQLETSILSDRIFFAMIVITTLRVLGIMIFVTIIFLMLKIKPKRLRLSDYFIALSVTTLLSMNIIDAIRDVKYHIFEGRYFYYYIHRFPY